MTRKSRLLIFTIALLSPFSPLIAMEFVFGGDIARCFRSLLDSTPIPFYLQCFIEGINAGWFVLLCFYALLLFLLFIMPWIGFLTKLLQT